MNYLERKIDAYLSEWKENPERNPLIVKGARQIGKTESVMHFARKNYKSVIYINFVEEPQFKGITAEGYKSEMIRKNISRLKVDAVFVEGDTLLFFDELQEFPDIATSLKFFKIEGKYDVISLMKDSTQIIEYQSGKFCYLSAENPSNPPILPLGIKARTCLGRLRMEAVMTRDKCPGIEAAENREQLFQPFALAEGTGVGRMPVRVEAALVADTNRAMVQTFYMGTHLAQQARVGGGPVGADVKMVTRRAKTSASVVAF